MLAIQQVEQRAVAQGALGHLHLVDLEQVEHGTQHTDAAADDRAPVFLQTVHAHLVRAAGRHQLLAQPVQALAGDGAGGPAGGAQHVTHRAYGSRRAVGHVPGIAVIGAQRFFQHGLRGDLGGFERRRR